jgi:hypothetical protein
MAHLISFLQQEELREQGLLELVLLLLLLEEAQYPAQQ